MKEGIHQKLSRKIKKLRQKQGISQEKLAELAKTGYKYLQRIEGKTPPDVRLRIVHPDFCFAKTG